MSFCVHPWPALATPARCGVDDLAKHEANNKSEEARSQNDPKRIRAKFDESEDREEHDYKTDPRMNSRATQTQRRRYQQAHDCRRDSTEKRLHLFVVAKSPE